MSLRNILVTGANKGIGEAIVRKILREHNDVFVILGSRNYDNGLSTKTKILEDIPKSKDRIEVLVIDVSDDTSVMMASKEAAEKYQSLYSIVNNAGIGGSSSQYKDILNVNFLGIKRVFEKFHSLLKKNGKVVNVTSAAGPKFVEQMETGPFKNALASKQIVWKQLDEILNSYIAARDSEIVQHGFGDLKSAYGISKALANAYTLLTAREHPNFIINSCTPGFIATDMTQVYWEKAGKTAEEIGCKPVEDGAYSPCHLLFNIETSGKYYGSDGLRSPLDKYRGPGEKEYESESEEAPPSSKY